MTSIVPIQPPLAMETPRGKADAYWLIDYGIDEHLYWVTFLRGSGECWTFKNPDIRLAWNESTGTGKRMTSSTGESIPWTKPQAK